MRFKGFEGEWEKKKLGEVAEIFKGKGISKEQLSLEGIPCILYGELYTKYKSEIISEVISRTNINEFGLIKSTSNDVIIPASGETAIDISTARCVVYDDVLLGGDLNILRLKNDNGVFLSYQINSRRKFDIAKLAQGISVVHLYGGKLKTLNVYFPNIAEQHKIASFLSLIDERIATQMKTIEEWEKMMKGLRNKIFSELNGEVVLLGEIANIYQPKTIDSSQLIQNGEYLVFGANGIIGKYHSFNHKLPQICITCRGASCGNINFTATESYITGNAMVINIDDKFETINKRFLYYQLLTYNFTNIITGSGQPQIVRSPLIKIKIRLPHIEIQNQIVSILDKIEEKLTLEKSILSSYQQQKKYLLQNLFI